MIHGYLLALASGSALDQRSNNTSLFNLVETVTVPEELLGRPLPIQMHFYMRLASEAQGRKFEMRLVRVAPDEAVDAGEPFGFETVDKPRFRLNTTSFRLPKAFGEYLLHAEWRVSGEETWHVDDVEWPLIVQAPPVPERSESPAE